MELEVLVATMKQKDENLFRKMNLQSNAVIANQSDTHEYREYTISGNNVKIITTNDRGVGKNRNMAMLNSNADIIMFADDDMTFVDNYKNPVIKAFDVLSDADIIVFELELNTNNDRVNNRKIERIGRVRLHNFMRYGTCRISCRRKSILKGKFWFEKFDATICTVLKTDSASHRRK